MSGTAPGAGSADPPHPPLAAVPAAAEGGPGDGPAAPHVLPAPSRARRAPTRGQMARRRFAVGAAKRLLPLGAVLLLAAVALWPEIEGAEDRGRVAFRRVTQARPEALRIVEPRFQGVDELGRPYTVTAAAAVQTGSADILDLEGPKGDVVLGDGAWVYVEARGGRYDRARNHLDLEGDVRIFHDDGTRMDTDRAAVEVAAGDAAGDAPVRAQGPFGTLDAEGFRLTGRGSVVVFTGRSRAMLEGGR